MADCGQRPDWTAHESKLDEPFPQAEEATALADAKEIAGQANQQEQSGVIRWLESQGHDPAGILDALVESGAITIAPGARRGSCATRLVRGRSVKLWPATQCVLAWERCRPNLAPPLPWPFDDGNPKVGLRY